MKDLKEILVGKYNLLEKKGLLFIYQIEERVKLSIDFIENKYKHYKEFADALFYSTFYHSNTISADVAKLLKLLFYPETEVELELNFAVSHALIGSYKASLADLRRALELSLVSVYLSSKHVDRNEAIQWIKSELNTPQFSKIINKISKYGYYKQIDESYNWKENLKKLYWNLSDYSHNKGVYKGYRELNDFDSYISGTPLVKINTETLEMFCDFFIDVVKEIVTIQALNNPIILVGLPIEQKFGDNPPAAGYFNEEQAKFIKQLIPEKYKPFFDKLIKEDKNIADLIDYFNSLPTKE